MTHYLKMNFAVKILLKKYKRGGKKQMTKEKLDNFKENNFEFDNFEKLQKEKEKIARNIIKKEYNIASEYDLYYNNTIINY